MQRLPGKANFISLSGEAYTMLLTTPPHFFSGRAQNYYKKVYDDNDSPPGLPAKITRPEKEALPWLLGSTSQRVHEKRSKLE